MVVIHLELGDIIKTPDLYQEPFTEILLHAGHILLPHVLTTHTLPNIQTVHLILIQLHHVIKIVNPPLDYLGLMTKDTEQVTIPSLEFPISKKKS